MTEARLTAELVGLLGCEGFIKLTDAYGGVRLYLPRAGAKLTRLLGKDGSEALAERYRGSYLRIPLAREPRAREYRLSGLSNAKIARKLGLTETGVDKMFQRMNANNEKPEKGPQLNLFPARAKKVV